MPACPRTDFTFLKDYFLCVFGCFLVVIRLRPEKKNIYLQFWGVLNFSEKLKD